MNEKPVLANQKFRELQRFRKEKKNTNKDQSIKTGDILIDESDHIHSKALFEAVNESLI
jgi:hypothetical protein